MVGTAVAHWIASAVVKDWRGATRSAKRPKSRSNWGERAQVVSLRVAIRGGDESMTKQVGDLLRRGTVGVESCGERMSQSVRAKPVKKATALVSAIDGRANRARGQGPANQLSLADK